MGKYIKLDDAIGIITEHQGIRGDTFKALHNAYAIDIVRCAECRFKSLYDGETKYYYCALEDRPNRNWSVDDWNFCFWGERKENE